MTRGRLLPVCAAAVAAALSGPPVAAQAEKPVYVQYEGFILNDDKSVILSFGYINTNDADVVIAVGGANQFVPAPAGRGQPTTFQKGRHRSVCVMVLPAGLDGNLRWSVTHGGYQSITTARVLDPLYALEEGSAKRALTALTRGAPKQAACLAAEDAGQRRR